MLSSTGPEGQRGLVLAGQRTLSAKSLRRSSRMRPPRSSPSTISQPNRAKMRPLRNSGRELPYQSTQEARQWSFRPAGYESSVPSSVS
jgi:hypothetical protein